MKKWNLVGTLHFRAHDFECEAEDKDEALEKLLKAGLFDHSVCSYKLEELETDEE